MMDFYLDSGTGVNADNTYSLSAPVVTNSPSAPVAITLSMGGTASFGLISTHINGTVNATSIITICLHKTFPVAGVIGGCNIQLVTDSTNTQRESTNTATPLYAGIYYYTAYTNYTNANVSVAATLTVRNCPADQVLVGATCVGTTGVTVGVQTSFTTTSAAATTYLATALPTNIVVSPVTNLTFSGPSNINSLTVTGFYGLNVLSPVGLSGQQNVAFVAVANVSGVVATVSIPSAISGLWYYEVTVNASAAGVYNVQLTQESAVSLNQITNLNTYPAPSQGPVTISNLTATPALTYISYNGSSTDSAWRVGVSATDDTKFNSQVSVYVAAGYLPYKTPSGNVIADWVGGCTLPAAQCTDTITIDLGVKNISAPYYVAIAYNNATAPALKFLLWVSTSMWPCPACNHGSCSATDASYGVCKCTYMYAGVNCNTAVGTFKVQIIVVIIIGGLLLLTAAIGLVAWIISKRNLAKKGGYEKV